MHILVIEDEEQLCCSIAEGLRLNGYETDTCFDGDEGLELCLTENYDLILLDLNLPGIDGLEILRQFREINSFTPVSYTHLFVPAFFHYQSMLLEFPGSVQSTSMLLLLSGIALISHLNLKQEHKVSLFHLL